jgi:outer membrane protein OmpA-like peptidoglycan-associated protein
MKTVLLACILLALVSPNVTAQDSGDDNYIVILGAYSSKENAENFSSQSQQRKLKTKVDLNKLNGKYYVYIPEIKNHDKAIAEVVRLRSTSPYKDAWAFHGTLGELIVTEVPKKEPVVEKAPEPVVVEPVVVAPIVVVKTKAEIEAEEARLRDEKIKREVDSQEMKVKKGEMEVLDHIYFFKDAAILRPESRYQVDKLAKNMKDYPNQKIKIHGHTNGDDPGKIIRRSGPDSDFFSLDNTIEDYGSSKELSEQRANLIRDYLVAQGIDKKRMSIKAEGGRKPIYRVDDDRAEANVRVEIEIVKN